MAAYVSFILRHRVLVLIACGAITVLAVLSMSRAVMATSLMEMILGSSPSYQRYVRLVESFGTDEQLIVAFEAPAWMRGPDAAGRVRALVDRLEAMDEIARVESVLGATQVKAGADRGTIDLDALAADPLAGGLLVSRDGRHVSFIVNMVPDTERSLERTPAFVARVVDAFADAGLERDAIHLGGLTATLGEVQTQMRRNFLVLLPAVAILLLGSIYVLFRRLWPAFVALAVGVIAIIWMMGFAVALDPKLNVIISICPALILIISFSDVVHLCSAYMLELAAGREREDAVRISASEVGTACVYTSITTLVGFL
ncbi:MAG: RND transporter family protein, partial [Planctomycetota bacterium]